LDVLYQELAAKPGVITPMVQYAVMNRRRWEEQRSMVTFD
jgi:hypothetical protein